MLVDRVCWSVCPSGHDALAYFSPPLRYVLLSVNIVAMESDSTSSLASILTNSSDSTYGNWFLVSLEVTDEIGWHALTPALVLMTLAILAVLSRSYTRAFLMKRTGVDDWLLIVALVCKP